MKEYIENYINKNYEITIEENWFMVKGKDGTLYKDTEWTHYIGTIFGSLDAQAMAKDWFYEGRKAVVEDITKFIKACYLRLGHLSWELVNPLGEVITSKIFCETFNNKYSEDFLHAFWTVQMLNLTQEKTHEIMGIPLK